jgi:hypothetical protein
MLIVDEYEYLENLEPLEDEEEDEDGFKEERREDKIFNNGYNTGEGLDDSEEYQFSKNIAVSNIYSDCYLKDLYDYENELNLKLILDLIFEIFVEDEAFARYSNLKKDSENLKKIKMSKGDVNFIFNRLHETITNNLTKFIFYSPIYLIEVISSISSLEYKKIFDMLNTENQELLLVELNEKYKFLDKFFNKK